MKVTRQQLHLYSRLLAVPFVLSLLDAFVTLYYQPAAYWQGDRSQVVEYNPFAWLALRIHPLVLVPGFIGWYALFWWLIFRTPAWIGLRFHLFLVINHLVAISGWLMRHHPNGKMISLIVAMLAIAADALCFLPFRRQWKSPQPVHLG